MIPIPTPSELCLIASSRPVGISDPATTTWVNTAAWALKLCADEMERLKEDAIKSELSIAFEVETFSKALAGDWQQLRDLDEDPIGYLVTRRNHTDFTTLFKDYDRAQNQTNEWNARGGDFIVLSLFARPGEAK